MSVHGDAGERSLKRQGLCHLIAVLVGSLHRKGHNGHNRGPGSNQQETLAQSTAITGRSTSSSCRLGGLGFDNHEFGSGVRVQWNAVLITVALCL